MTDTLTGTRLLTQDELARLLAPPRRIFALRDAAIVALFGAGISPADFPCLHVEHALAAGRGETVAVPARGKRVVFSLGAARAAVSAYLEHARPRLAKKPSTRLVLAQTGSHLKVGDAVRASQRAFERAGVPLPPRWRSVLRQSFLLLDPGSTSRREAERARPVPPPLPEPRSKARIKAYLLDVKRAANGCKDCGGLAATPERLTFDHLPRFEKRFNLAQARQHSLASVVAEVSKCELVCEPCHRARERARGR
jgi:hypothetical protein